MEINRLVTICNDRCFDHVDILVRAILQELFDLSLEAKIQLVLCLSGLIQHQDLNISVIIKRTSLSYQRFINILIDNQCASEFVILKKIKKTYVISRLRDYDACIIEQIQTWWLVMENKRKYSKDKIDLNGWPNSQVQRVNLRWFFNAQLPTCFAQ